MRGRSLGCRVVPEDERIVVPGTDDLGGRAAYDPSVSLLPDRERIADLTGALVLALLLVGLVLVTPEGPATTAGRLLAVGCALVQAATVVFLRRRPEAAMAVAVAAGIVIEA